MRGRLPESTRSFFESFSDRLVYQADFVDGDVDHKEVKFDTKFTSGNVAYNETLLVDTLENMKMEESEKLGNGQLHN